MSVKFPNNDLEVNGIYPTNITKLWEKPDKSYRWINLKAKGSMAILVRKKLDGIN